MANLIQIPLISHESEFPDHPGGPCEWGLGLAWLESLRFKRQLSRRVWKFEYKGKNVAPMKKKSQLVTCIALGQDKNFALKSKILRNIIKFAGEYVDDGDWVYHYPEGNCEICMGRGLHAYGKCYVCVPPPAINNEIQNDD